jgi:hypothetical protein
MNCNDQVDELMWGGKKIISCPKLEQTNCVHKYGDNLPVSKNENVDVALNCITDEGGCLLGCCTV